jgi:hypothetical protein
VLKPRAHSWQEEQDKQTAWDRVHFPALVTAPTIPLPWVGNLELFKKTNNITIQSKLRHERILFYEERFRAHQKYADGGASKSQLHAAAMVSIRAKLLVGAPLSQPEQNFHDIFCSVVMNFPVPPSGPELSHAGAATQRV